MGSGSKSHLSMIPSEIDLIQQKNNLVISKNQGSPPHPSSTHPNLSKDMTFSASFQENMKMIIPFRKLVSTQVYTQMSG
jgi:hypothetical protein